MKMLAKRKDGEILPCPKIAGHCLSPGRNCVLRKHGTLTMKLKS